MEQKELRTSLTKESLLAKTNSMQHSKLGSNYKILVEAEIGDKRYALISSRSYSKKNPGSGSLEWVNDPISLRIKDAKTRYYAFWGNTNDLEKMGITEILTKAGNVPRSLRTAYSQFHRMLKTGASLEFKN